MYYFCVDIPWENTCIWAYDNLNELKKENELHMKKYDDWYVIKGEEINIKEEKENNNDK